MIPELGKYTFAVLASYGVSLTLLAAIVGLSLWQSRRAKQQLAVIEARVKTNG